jgi:hypothetical protein
VQGSKLIWSLKRGPGLSRVDNLAVRYQGFVPALIGPRQETGVQRGDLGVTGVIRGELIIQKDGPVEIERSGGIRLFEGRPPDAGRVGADPRANSQVDVVAPGPFESAHGNRVARLLVEDAFVVPDGLPEVTARFVALASENEQTHIVLVLLECYAQDDDRVSEPPRIQQFASVRGDGGLCLCSGREAEPGQKCQYEPAADESDVPPEENHDPIWADSGAGHYVGQEL